MVGGLLLLTEKLENISLGVGDRHAPYGSRRGKKRLGYPSNRFVFDFLVGCGDTLYGESDHNSIRIFIFPRDLVMFAYGKKRITEIEIDAGIVGMRGDTSHGKSQYILVPFGEFFMIFRPDNRGKFLGAEFHT
jgi:hypothetical protein